MSKRLRGIDETVVLLAEDDAPVLRLISEWLPFSSYAVLEPDSGTVGLAERRESISPELRVVITPGSPENWTASQGKRNFLSNYSRGRISSVRSNRGCPGEVLIRPRLPVAGRRKPGAVDRQDSA